LIEVAGSPSSDFMFDVATGAFEGGIIVGVVFAGVVIAGVGIPYEIFVYVVSAIVKPVVTIMLITPIIASRRIFFNDCLNLV
jgi:hypothetical protein